MEKMNKLQEDWDRITELAIYGYGRKAVRMIDFIANDFDIKYIVDNNPTLKGKKINHVEIQPLVEVKEKLICLKILVTVGGVSYFSIKKSLEEMGLQEFVDFCSYEVFLTEWYWRNRNQVVMSESYITITSRYTFCCKNCDQLMPYYTQKTHWERDVVEIEETMDAFFSKADYLVSFFIVGGEPLLHSGLTEILRRVCKKYSNKIGYIQVITNGSIVPKQDLLEVIKLYGIDIRLSDYTCSIPYDKKLNEVKEVLEEKGIVYSMSKYEKWYDIGIPGQEAEQFETEEEVKQHAVDCAPCHVIAEKRFYYCGSYYNSVRCGFVEETEDGYIDLTVETTTDAKRRLLEYSRGNVDKGYLKVCNRCFGKSGKHLIEVEPAVQMRASDRRI